MNNQLEGRYNLELNFPGDGRLFLNYWDWAHGIDVCAEVKDVGFGFTEKTGKFPYQSLLNW